MGTRGWESVTKADLARLGAKQASPPKPSKFRNVKVLYDGLKFDSKHEASIWHELRLREKAGEITELERQVRIPLYAPALLELAAGRIVSVLVAEYVADFRYREVATGERQVIDAKGMGRRICPYPLKKKWLELQEGIQIIER